MKQGGFVAGPTPHPHNAIVEALSTGLVIVDDDGSAVWTNPALHTLLDPERRCDPTETTSSPSPIDPTSAIPLDEVKVGTGPQEISWTRPDGTARWLEISCQRVPWNGGDEERHLLLYEVDDVTDRHAELARTRNREWRLSRIEALARIGTWEWDIVGGEVTWSEQLLKTFGYPPDTELDYASYHSLLHPDDVHIIEDTLAEALKTAEPFTYTHRMYLADRRSLRVFECYGEVFTDAVGKPVRILGTAHDITEQKRVQEELAYLADHDPLTGLANRRAITALLRERLEHATETGEPSGALLLVDVDNFKDINDLRGHAIGDQVMRSVAELLAKRVDEHANLGRLGGDEFAIILASGTPHHAMDVAESICDAVANMTVVSSGTALRVTSSVGVAPLASQCDCDTLLARADLALYEAKGAGRNRVRLFAAEQYHHAVQRVSIPQRVRRALEGGGMALDAQPIHDLATGTVASYELLIRLRDGEKPRLGPAEFLPPVERDDLIVHLDRWVIEQAAGALATPAARTGGLRFEVNVSARSLQTPDFGDWVVRTLQDTGVAPDRLGLEITETAAITNLEAVRRLADRLTHEGCRLLLDDFGAGFGSFVYLKHLPFTAVKVDGEFVRHVDHVATDRVLVEAIVWLASGLGITTIAEYIDREALRVALSQLGVECGQGFHLGPPTPLSDLLERHGHAGGQVPAGCLTHPK